MKHTKDKFFLWASTYLVIALVCLFLVSRFLLPPGSALVGHDSGLPTNAKTFLLSRLYAWDDRLNFGLDNSVNFGSLTIHFFDWLSSVAAGVPYAGNYVSLFFWLAVIFAGAFFLAYQFKRIFGKPFIFILPVFVTFNFYVFQSVFMLERAKFGVFAATFVSLALYLRNQDKKIGTINAALISALVFSVFNGGGLFGTTYFGGTILIFVLLVLAALVNGIRSKNYQNLKRTALFMVFMGSFFLVFNLYAILPYLSHFLTIDPTALFQRSLLNGNEEWLNYVSRATSYLNLFRFFGVPDWYGAYVDADKANTSHPYAFIYLNSILLSSVSFLFPLLSFSSLVLARGKKQKLFLSFFGLVALIGIFLAAGSHKPLGYVFQFFMASVPGFVLFRSAFYKFEIFYLFGMCVLLATVFSFFIDWLVRRVSGTPAKVSVVFLTFLVIVSWLGYHWVLFDQSKIFSWKSDQSTKVSIPGYVSDFAVWTNKNNLKNKRVLLLPPVNKNWEADAYSWGYWSLSPLPYAMSNADVLSYWHGLTEPEEAFIQRLYNFVDQENESDFLRLAQRLNIGYVLLRNDVLVDSTWSASQRPESYQKAISSFKQVEKVKNFGQWDLYKLTSQTTDEPSMFTTSAINIAPDKYISLSNEFFSNQFFGEGHSIGLSAVAAYPNIRNIPERRMNVLDCISCPLEKKPSIQDLPDVKLLPNSIFYTFKQKSDEKLLSVKKDPQDKMGDYLGLVLRRTTEQKRMIDMGIKEKYLVDNAQVIRSYLEQLRSLLQNNSENSNDFEIAAQFRDYLTPVERMFGDYITTSEFKKSGQPLSDETLGIVWSLGKIDEFFSSITLQTTSLSTHKVYKMSLDRQTQYQLFLPAGSLPKDNTGKVLSPAKVELTDDQKTLPLVFEAQPTGWLKTTFTSQSRGSATMALDFLELPNLLTIEGTQIEGFAYGKADCLVGDINNFSRSKDYEIRVWKKNNSRHARVIFSDPNFTYSSKHTFLQGEDSFDVPSYADGNFFRYIYFPSVSATSIKVYVCSDDTSAPDIEKIEVREYFSPPVLSITGNHGKNGNTAGLNTDKIVDSSRLSPTEYKASITQTGTPRVLVFNQQFDPSWRLYEQGQIGKGRLVTSHFMVDGYANGWYVVPNNSRYTISYEPQIIFNKVSKVSLLAYLISILWLLISFFRKINSNV